MIRSLLVFFVAVALLTMNLNSGKVAARSSAQQSTIVLQTAGAPFLDGTTQIVGNTGQTKRTRMSHATLSRTPTMIFRDSRSSVTTTWKRAVTTLFPVTLICCQTFLGLASRGRKSRSPETQSRSLIRTRKSLQSFLDSDEVILQLAEIWLLTKPALTLTLARLQLKLLLMISAQAQLHH